ncbi:MAG: hypothetical protein Q9O62_09045 [Ardenticatenia bacterium]|nr:hypothetical protein [Ardenticatenia bacterium]
MPRLIVTYTVPTPIPTPTPTPQPSLRVYKLATPAGPVGFGHRVTYTLAYGNPWHNTISNVVVTDRLPPNMRLVGATPAPATTPGPNSPITWNVGTLAPGDSDTITMIAETITRTWTVNLTETWTARFEGGQVQDLQVTYTLPVTLTDGWDATNGVSVTLALDARLRAQSAGVIPSDVLVAVVNTDDGATVTARPTSIDVNSTFTLTVLACYWGDANTGPRRENEVWLDDGLATRRMVSHRSEALDTYSLIAKSCPDALSRNPLPDPVPTVEARWRNAARISGRAGTTEVAQWSNTAEHSAEGYRTGLIYLPVVGR